MNPTTYPAGMTAGASCASSRVPSGLFTALCWLQGFYYLATGICPIVSIETFIQVTGPKTDHLVRLPEDPQNHWLVRTVGAVVAANGIVFLMAAWRRQTAAEIAVLAIANAIALTAIDVVYVAREVIPPIYLVDAAAEVVLIAAWLVAQWRQRTVTV
jgi:hypothetical protein